MVEQLIYAFNCSLFVVVAVFVVVFVCVFLHIQNQYSHAAAHNCIGTNVKTSRFLLGKF